MELDRLAAWPVHAVSFERAVLGLNNETYFVHAREGELVIRIYRNATDPARVRAEHDLLAGLARAGLPFATPVPLPTRDGDTLAVLETADGPRLAALFARIPGVPAALDAMNARLGGAALARVDAALERSPRPPYGPPGLCDVHELVPDPYDAIPELVAGDLAHHVRRLFERVDAAHETLVASLPDQIVHGDFAFPNLLVEGGRVTGLVDFEFAGVDLRAADLATALYIVVVRARPADVWSVIGALASGYRRVLPLDTAEIAALPELMVRRSAVGLVHWIGRWRAGVAERTEPVSRVERSARFVRWIDENGPRLALTVAGALPPPAP